jgi:GNAT superfamily N-acetyltransferase
MTAQGGLYEGSPLYGEVEEITVSAVTFVEWGTPSDARQPLLDALISCWVEVTNAGGAVGFPSPPIDRRDVEPVMAALVASLQPTTTRAIIALVAGELAGWVVVARNTVPLTAHWATIQRLQTLPRFRGQGIARALMDRATVTARDVMGVEHLWLTARGGMGLEDFYVNLGWREIGRHPGALRLKPGDDRDEIFMVLEQL